MTNFKQNFTYNNIGIVVGNINYAKEIVNNQGGIIGYEFLINARGFGSTNVKLFNEIGQRAFDNFPVSSKPEVRINLAKLDQFTSEKGNTYTSVLSFVEMEEAKNAQGEQMAHQIAGRLAGEVTNVQNLGNHIKFQLVVHNTDKEGNLVISNKTGQPMPPSVFKLEIHDLSIVPQGFGNGANVEVGYYYLNKQEVAYDQFGFPIGDSKGTRIERIEAKKIMLKHAGQQMPTGQQQMGGMPNVAANMPSGMGMGGQQQQQPQGNPFGQPNGGFGQMQQQGQQMTQNPFTGQQMPVQQQNDPTANLSPQDFMNVDTTQPAPFEQGFQQQQQQQPELNQVNSFFGQQQQGFQQPQQGFNQQPQGFGQAGFQQQGFNPNGFGQQ